jgi:hypothetical protein
LIVSSREGGHSGGGHYSVGGGAILLRDRFYDDGKREGLGEEVLIGLRYPSLTWRMIRKERT